MPTAGSAGSPSDSHARIAAFYKRPTLHPDTIRAAQKLGAGGELRARLEKAAPNFTIKAALIFLRVSMRDATVLTEIPSFGAEFPATTFDRKYVSTWGLALAKELAGWPEAAAANREFLAVAVQGDWIKQ